MHGKGLAAQENQSLCGQKGEVGVNVSPSPPSLEEKRIFLTSEGSADPENKQFGKTEGKCLPAHTAVPPQFLHHAVICYRMS